MAKVISFECPDNLVRELERISATAGVTRSELLREGINHVVRHYNMVDSEPSCKEILMEIKSVIKDLTKVG